MSNLTPAVRERLERLRGVATRARERAREVTTVAVETLESSGTAGLIGYLESRRQVEGRQPLQILGASLEGAVGLAAHAAALTGMGKGNEEHLRAVGNGAFAVLSYKKGRELGAHATNALPPGTP